MDIDRTEIECPPISENSSKSIISRIFHAVIDEFRREFTLDGGLSEISNDEFAKRDFDYKYGTPDDSTHKSARSFARFIRFFIGSSNK